MKGFIENGIKSANDLVNYLKENKVRVDRVVQVESSQNVIHLPEFTTMNWKSGRKSKNPENAKVRVNCKGNIMKLIEAETNLEHIDNGVGDNRTHPYSFILENVDDLQSVVDAFKTKFTFRVLFS